MARHLYVYDGRGYEGELALYRSTRVAAGAAEAADLPGLRPRFLFRIAGGIGEPAVITDDEVAVRRHVATNPGARVSIIPMMR